MNPLSSFVRAIMCSYNRLMSLSINQCRKILGESGEAMSDEAIKHLQNVFVLLSDFAITSYLEKRKSISDEKVERYENTNLQQQS